MGAELVLIVMTAFWSVIGIVLPILVHFCMLNSPNRGVIQTCLILIAFSCYIFWLCAYLCQLNPLLGPELDTNLIRYLKVQWAP